MSTDTLKPMLFSIADALEIDLTVKSFKIEGKRKAVYEVFEGYSPTVIAQITDSLIDEPNGIVAGVMQVWGNLQIMVINDKRANLISLFVLDRSKQPQDDPFGKFWSRKHTYAWLAFCTQAVYYRSVFDTVWSRLPQGPQKLKTYNAIRSTDGGASKAYFEMWKEV